jgi:hypothetical protein
VQGLFDSFLTRDMPRRIVGNRAHDSDTPDRALAGEGVELIAARRSSRRPRNKTQDGGPLRPYQHRWTVRCAVAWS